jgi:HSP20 family protein
MADEKKKKPEIKIDADMNALGLGGILGAIDKLAKLADDLKDAGGELKREGEVDLSNIKEGLKATYGFNIKTAAGSSSSATSSESFKPFTKPAAKSSAKPAAAQPTSPPPIPKELEPEIDMFTEGDTLKIYVQMPGVEESEIKLELNGDLLDIIGKGTRQTYRKELMLEAKIVPASLTQSYKNGILELTLAIQQ